MKTVAGETARSWVKHVAAYRHAARKMSATGRAASASAGYDSLQIIHAVYPA